MLGHRQRAGVVHIALSNRFWIPQSKTIPRIKQSGYQCVGVKNDCTSTSTTPCILMSVRYFST